MKKVFLQKNQYTKLFEAQMEGFDINALDSMPFCKKIEYCKKYLGFPIGNGSSRICFQLDDNKILKLAKNKKGIAQNEEEYRKGSSYDILPQIFDADTRNYYWLISEYVLPSKAADFKKVTGYSWTVMKAFITTVASYYSKYYRPYLSDDDMEKILDYDSANSNVFSDLYTFITDFGDNVGDYLRLANWGMTLRNGEPYMVILDSGLSDNIYKQFYK